RSADRRDPALDEGNALGDCHHRLWPGQPRLRRKGVRARRRARDGHPGSARGGRCAGRGAPGRRRVPRCDDQSSATRPARTAAPRARRYATVSRHLSRLSAALHQQRRVRRGPRSRRDSRRRAPLSSGTQGPSHGLERRRARRRPAAVRSRARGRALLLPALLLSGGPHQPLRDDGHRAAEAGVVRVGRALRRCRGAGTHPRHAVPPGEESGLGSADARELCGDREGVGVIVIPAVDVKDGRCVRLREGRADAETVFSEDPVAMATQWAARGAQRLHVVELDGAFGGARQTALVAKIVAAVAPIPVEVGGGLRDVTAVESVLEAGARWAVLGTRAALDEGFLREVCGRCAARIIVAVDARGDHVAVRGWTEVADVTVIQVGRRALDAGAAALLYTDVSRDGTERGPNVDDTVTLARAVRLPVLASGGVGGLGDIATLAAVADAGIEGVVVGRALYTGAVSLSDAMRAAARAPLHQSHARQAHH